MVKRLKAKQCRTLPSSPHLLPAAAVSLAWPSSALSCQCQSARKASVQLVLHSVQGVCCMFCAPKLAKVPALPWFCNTGWLAQMPTCCRTSSVTVTASSSCTSAINCNLQITLRPAALRSAMTSFLASLCGKSALLLGHKARPEQAKGTCARSSDACCCACWKISMHCLLPLSSLSLIPATCRLNCSLEVGLVRSSALGWPASD